MERLPRLIAAIICLVVAFFVGNYVLKHFLSDEVETTGFSGDYTFPSNQTILNHSGNVLEVRLKARNEKYVQFDRLPDGKEFLYLIDDLDPQSKRLVQRFPNSGLQNAGTHIDQTAITLNEVHTEALREAIDKLDQKVEFLQAKLRKNPDTATRRAIYQNIDSINKEKMALIERIASYDKVSGDTELSNASSTNNTVPMGSTTTHNGSREIPIKLVEVLDQMRNASDQ